MKKVLLTLAVILCACAIAAARQTRTILVFPFENRSASADVGWISEAFAEVLARRLAAPERLVLNRDELNQAYQQYGIPPNSTLTLATEYKVAETLGVDWAVVGDFKVAGQQLTAEAQLLDVPKLKLYPVIHEDGSLTDLVHIQTRIVWTILKRYDADFQGGSEEAFARLFAPLPLDAFENYIRGILAQDNTSKLEFLNTAARLNPSDHRAAFALGQYYFEQKDYANSGYWLAKLNSNDSNYLKALFLRGVDAFFLGDNRSAEAAFRTLSAQLPLNEVWNNLGVLEARRGDYQEALASFTRAYQGDPSDPTYSYNLGACYTSLTQYAEASRYLEKALREEPTDLGARTLLAYTLNRQGNQAGSRAQLEWVSEHDGRAMADLNADILPQARIKRTYNGEAYRLLSVAVNNSLEAELSKLPLEERGRVHLARGEEFVKEGRLMEAVRELTEAVSLLPNDSSAHLFLGQAYELEGEHAKAIAEFQSALRFDNSAVTHLWLAHAYFSLRSYSQALKESQMALDQDPGNPDAERLIDSIQQRTNDGRRKP
jgi:tetratricopeptide (TPR) repeat protein